MSTCGMGCPDSLICRDHGCQWEAENAQAEAYYREQERIHYEEMERLHWLELEGHCWAHDVHEQTCPDCLTVARDHGLRPCDQVPNRRQIGNRKLVGLILNGGISWRDPVPFT